MAPDRLAAAGIGRARFAGGIPNRLGEVRPVGAAESDLDRLGALEAERAARLAEVLGKGLRFDGWQLLLSGSEATPMGGIFVRLLDPQLLTFKTVCPTYWNSGPSAVLRQVEIAPNSPLHAKVALLKRESHVIVSGLLDDLGQRVEK